MVPITAATIIYIVVAKEEIEVSYYSYERS
jgi:hypothetical protein